MDGFIRYDDTYVPDAFGFKNMGSTCYLNALIQSLFSCSSFVETFDKNKNELNYITNPISGIMVRGVEVMLNPEEPNRLDILSNFSPAIWCELIKYASTRADIVKFSGGQQCAREGFYMIMDCMEHFMDIQRLFLHRDSIKLFCNKCDNWTQAGDDTSIIFDVQPDLKTDQFKLFQELDPNHKTSMNMNDFLYKQHGYVDKDHICSICKEKCMKYKIVNLVMAPEILVVLSKKYSSDGSRKIDYMTPFPQELVFNGLCDDGTPTKFYYDAVAQIEHSGGLHGGHYWAICKRKNGVWYLLNDSHIEKSKFEPTKNTYIVFYHIR